MVLEPLTLAVAGLIGACLGSFATMASHRLPRDEEIVRTPSHCVRCGHKLGLPDLLPVLSWLAMRGRCRHCSAKISIRYPLIELTAALIMVVLVATYGVTWQMLLLAALALGLIIIVVSDLETGLIPDKVQICLLPLGLIYRHHIGAPWSDTLMGLGLGLFLGLLLHHGYRWLRKKEGLGLGDVKFFAVAGAWLGLVSFVPFLFLSGILGILTALLWRVLNRGPVFPFGPALALALMISAAMPQQITFFWLMLGHPIN